MRGNMKWFVNMWRTFVFKIANSQEIAERLISNSKLLKVRGLKISVPIYSLKLSELLKNDVLTIDFNGETYSLAVDKEDDDYKFLKCLYRQFKNRFHVMENFNQLRVNAKLVYDDGSLRVALTLRAYSMFEIKSCMSILALDINEDNITYILTYPRFVVKMIKSSEIDYMIKYNILRKLHNIVSELSDTLRGSVLIVTERLKNGFYEVESMFNNFYRDLVLYFILAKAPIMLVATTNNSRTCYLCGRRIYGKVCKCGIDRDVNACCNMIEKAIKILELGRVPGGS